MRYSADVDSNFIDRPHQTIRHCMLQKSIGEKMDQTGIRMTDVGKFTIQYFKNNMKKIHYLDFGNDYKMPSCSCYTWKKSAYIRVSIFSQFFRNLLPGIGMPFQDCIRTCPTLI